MDVTKKVCWSRSNGRDKKRLSETSRPGLISVMRPGLSQSTHRFIPKHTLWNILLLRLKVSHLCPEDKILISGNDTEFRTKTELFRTTRDRTCLLEGFESVSVLKDRHGHPVLRRDGGPFPDTFLFEGFPFSKAKAKAEGSTRLAYTSTLGCVENRNT